MSPNLQRQKSLPLLVCRGRISQASTLEQIRIQNKNKILKKQNFHWPPRAFCMSKIHTGSHTDCTLKSHPCPALTARGARTKTFTLKLKMWSGHCSCKTVHQRQSSETVSRGSVSETTPATIQQEFCPQEDPRCNSHKKEKTPGLQLLVCF